MHVDGINVLAELERCGVTYKWAGESEVKVRCPFHSDDSPSCNVSVEKRVFQCHAAGCMAKGDFVSFLARLLNTTRAVVLVDLGTRYTLEDDKLVDPQVVERWHHAIWAAQPLLKELYARALTDEDIRKYRLGCDGDRVTIPIKNESGHFVNVRKYMPGAPGKDKMKNLRGRGRARLFPVDQLKYDKIILCGGECKAIVAARLLNPHGIGAITATCGEDNWEPAFTPRFKDKQVWVCLDVDDEGQAAAQKKCGMLQYTADWLANIVLPLDRDSYPHGDVNDFVASGGDLLELLESASEWVAPAYVELDDSEPEAVVLSDAVKATYVGKRLQMNAVVTAMDTAPYVIPCDCLIDCDRSQKECAVCPVMNTGRTEFRVHPESVAILDMVSTHRNAQREALMRAFNIPLSCKVCEVVPKTYYNAEDVRVSPELDITNRTAERIVQPAVCIGHGLELNEHYCVTGRMYPHPKNQQSTLIVSTAKPTQDALSTYEARDTDALQVFQPKTLTVAGLRDKLTELYTDFEANVTRVYQRRALHLFADLAYHSPLLFNFDEQTVKGWVEVLIMGDSSQGKSETINRLLEHYQLGQKVECKNASVAGLLGGLQKFGDRWFVMWGVIPTHDKRLVVLEELKGTSVDVIGKLTDMRSSGVAEIPKIERRRTHARTRLIALSNPRSDRPLKTYNFGVMAIKELIGNLEDVRRFDAALLVSAEEINAEELNKLCRHRPEAQAIHTSTLCRELILWAWTREPSQVKFTDKATNAILDYATSMCDQFTEVIPLVDRGSMRYKLARLAAALAARTFCSDGTTLTIHDCHVEFIAEWLSRLYANAIFGYRDFTEALNVHNTLLDPGILKKRINGLPYPKDFVKHILHANWIDLFDIQDWCGWDRADAQELLSLLVRKYALIREGRKYRKSSQFIDFLKALLTSDDIVDRPAFLEEEF